MKLKISVTFFFIHKEQPHVTFIDIIRPLQDSLGFWIPRFGTTFQILLFGVPVNGTLIWIPTFIGIPDSLS